jgi:single-strand DNA-binding protein
VRRNRHPIPITDPAPRLVTKVGNLTADPVLAFSASGKAWAILHIAVDTPKTPGDWGGERETTFYEAVVFDGIARNACASLLKGCRVIVHGQPEIREYEADDGTVRQVKRIIAQAAGPDLRFASAHVTRAQHTARTRPPAQPQPQPAHEEDPWASF